MAYWALVVMALRDWASDGYYCVYTLYSCIWSFAWNGSMAFAGLLYSDSIARIVVLITCTTDWFPIQYVLTITAKLRERHNHTLLTSQPPSLPPPRLKLLIKMFLEPRHPIPKPLPTPPTSQISM